MADWKSWKLLHKGINLTPQAPLVRPRAWGATRRLLPLTSQAVRGMEAPASGLAVNWLRMASVRVVHMAVFVQTVGLLCLSNVFMTFAWYAHLRDMNHKPWYIAALVSWGIALLEYLIQVPANRIGHTQMRLDQLKILQEVITLSVFIPFALFYMKKPLRLDYLWAGLCLLLAAYFVFRRDS